MRYLLPFVAVLFTATLIWSRDSDRREFCKTRNAPTHPSVFVNDCMSARCWNVSKKNVPSDIHMDFARNG